MPDSVPNNLPVDGKSLLDNFPKKDEGGISSVAPVSPPSPVARPPMAETNGSLTPEIPKVKRNSFGPTTRPSASPVSPAIDDIFADVPEVPASPPVPGMEKSEAFRSQTVVETPQRGFKKIFIIIGSVVLLAGALGVGGYFAYDKFLKPASVSPDLNVVLPPVDVPAPSAEPVVENPVSQPVNSDSDNDGLLNSEEAGLGTDPTNPDTDGDLLFDREEVAIYGTDPLNPDTDGDTYKDGSEVQGGYDPRGPGKLIKIPAQ